MKVSTKARYGFRFMIHLGKHFEKGLLQIREIAAKEHISPKYLEQIAMSMKIAGLVKVVRGAKGGYILSRPPEEIRLLDIFRAAEGDVVLTDCIDHPETCSMSSDCIMNSLWKDLNACITSYMADKTLASLITGKNSSAVV